MSPWDSQSFRKHNKKAGKKQLKVGAAEANRVLRKTGNEGLAVRKGNAAIKAMRNNAKKARKKK